VLFNLANLEKSAKIFHLSFDFDKKKTFRFVSVKKMSIFAAALKTNHYGYL